MKIDETPLEADLRTLGFTPMEARVYLCLWKNPGASAYLLGKEVGAPRSTIYACLDRLVECGAAWELAGDTRSFRCRDPEDFLRSRLGQLEECGRRLSSGLASLGRPAAPEPYLNIQGRSAVDEAILDLVEGAGRELLLNLGADPGPWLPALSRASGRGVDIVAFSFAELPAGFPPARAFIRSGPGFSAGRHWSLMACADMERALIADGEGADSASATLSRNPFFCRTVALSIHLDIYLHELEKKAGAPLITPDIALGTLMETRFHSKPDGS